jgi:replicative DNA helicase
VPRDDLSFRDGDHPGDFVLEKPRTAISTLEAILPKFLDKLERGEPPVAWRVDDQPWGNFAFRPGRIIVVGGPTNVGKTAFGVNTTMRALARNPELRACIASVEDDVDDLVCRGIAGLLQIPVDQLRERHRAGIADIDIARVRDELRGIGPRLCIVRRPFTLDQVIKAAEDFGAALVTLDYLQEVRLAGSDSDLVETIRRVMPMLRSLADKGPSVLAMSALSRDGTRQVEGLGGLQGYRASDLAVFQGGMPIEHAADDGFLLLNDGSRRRVTVAGQDDDAPLPMWLRHLKARSGVTTTVPLWFEGRFQRFSLRELTPGPDDTAAASTKSRSSRPSRKPAEGTALPPGVVAKQSLPRKDPQDDHWIT